jgi:hypothetical protein
MVPIAPQPYNGAMAAPPPPPAGEPEVFEATRAEDGSGAVFRHGKLTRQQAIDRRRTGGDIVVCRPDPFANDRLAGEIEQAVTPSGRRPIYHGPHLGPDSLPHWQQPMPPPAGHSFHETPVRRARVAP